MSAKIVTVSSSPSHDFSKSGRAEINLLAGLGVEDDAHAGVTVKHRSRVAQDPTQPNLRQVHLIQTELFDELASKGFRVLPGDLGENMTTAGIDLLALPVDTVLKIGESAEVQMTGLRNPCAQIEKFQAGLLSAVLDRSADGALIRKAGVMGIVITGGTVKPGDTIHVTLPPHPHRPLERV